MKIPGYTIIRELGSGGMATVYLARQDRLTRQVALKVMKPIAVAGGDFLTRFVKEGQIIAQLQHPQIVTIYDFDSADGFHYFSMEYLPGGTLADEIKKGMPVARAISITKKIAEALAVAHARGVIHRDVKPQNILFRLDGTPVLTDFGIARAVTRDADSMQLTSYGMVIGSPRYMSPEQSTGQALDARSDLYSLGVVFYETLTNQLPYQADDVVSLAMKHCNDPIPRLPNGLHLYQPILDQLIAKKPDDRFASAGHLIRALEAFETTQTAPVAMADDATRIVPRGTDRGPTGPEPLTPPEPKPKGSSTKLVLAILGAVLLAAIGAYLAMPSPGDKPWQEITDQLPPEQPNRPETVVQYERLAIEHFLKSQTDQSLEIIRLGLSITPSDARLLKLRGLIEARIAAAARLEDAQKLQDDGQLDESLDKVEEGLALEPGNEALKALRVELQQQLAEKAKRRADEVLARARKALDEHRLQDAMRLADQGLDLSPDHSGLLDLKKEIAEALEQARSLDEKIQGIKNLIAAGQLDEGLAAIERALADHPSHPELLDLQRLIQRQLERDKERRLDTIYEQASSHLQRGDYQQALQLIAGGLELAPEHAKLKALQAQVEGAQAADAEREADAILARATEAFNQEDLQASRDLIEQGLKLVPEHRGLLALKDRMTSKQAADQAIAERIRECQSRFPIGQIALDKALEVFECYSAILSTDPGNAPAQSAIGELSDALAAKIPELLAGYRLSQAESALASLQKISPEHGKLASLQEDLQRRRDFFPELVVIKGGCYEMGSPLAEAGREQDERPHNACIDDFQLGRYEVTVLEMKRFVKDTGYRTDAERGVGNMNGCQALDRDDKGDPWGVKTWASWRKPNKYQETRDKDPVSCVSWNDANAYIAWLNEKTRHSFRLPTEAEWEYAARAGSGAARFWGDETDARACELANSADEKTGWDSGFPCSDGNEWVAPVGSFMPSPWGLFDMLGNVWEWTCSEYDPDYRGNELLCTPSTVDAPRVMRGGAWNSGPALIRSAYRNRNFPESRYSFVGFRLAHDSPGEGSRD